VAMKTVTGYHRETVRADATKRADLKKGGERAAGLERRSKKLGRPHRQNVRRLQLRVFPLVHRSSAGGDWAGAMVLGRGGGKKEG